MPWTIIEFGDVQIEPGNPRYPLNAGSAPCERMNFSAASSSSRVLTPGRIFPASRFIVLTRITRAAAIWSISSGLFLMIIGRSDVLFQPERGDHRPDVIVDLGRIA